MPARGVTGQLVLYQIRPDRPRIINGKPAKYELPRGSCMALDVPPRVRPQLADPRVPLLITTGIRQADAAVSKGICCVAILGIWAWRGSNDKGGKTALAEWEAIALNDRQVYLAFGSPVATHPGTYAAAARLKAFLAGRGAIVQIISLPPGANGTNQGLDDFLAAGHTKEELLALASPDLPAPPENEELPVAAVRYRLTPEGICREVATENGLFLEQLTNFAAKIVHQQIVTDGVDEQIVFEIEGAVNGTTKRFSVPATEFEAMTWVAEYLGAEAIVAAGPQAHDHARAAIQQLSGQIPADVVYQHTGWTLHDGRMVYLHAGGAIGADLEAQPGPKEPDRPTSNVNPGQDFTAAGSEGPILEDKTGNRGIRVHLPPALSGYILPSPPTGKQLVKALRCSLKFLSMGPDRIVFPIYAAIWWAAITIANFSVLLSGKTGSGKTTVASLAQQHFGTGWNFQHLPGSWASTPYFLQSLLFLAKHTLVVLDDWVPTGSQGDKDKANRNADLVLRSQGNNSGRGRCHPDGRPKEPKPPRGLAFITGEAVPHGVSLNARILNTEARHDELLSPANLPKITACQKYAEKGLFAQAMSAFLNWLAPQYEQKVAEVKSQATCLRDVFREHCIHPRSAVIAGELLAGLELFLEFAREQGALSDAEFDDIWQRFHIAMFEVLAVQNLHLESDDPVQKFQACVAAALLSGRAHVAGKNGDPCEKAWGWRQETQLVRKDQQAVPEAGSADAQPKDEYEEMTRWRANGTCIGMLHGGELYLIVEASLAAAQDMAKKVGPPLPLNEKTLGKALHERGLLLTRDMHRGRYTVRANFLGKRTPFLHIHPSSVLSPPWHACNRLEPGHEGPMDGIFPYAPPEG